MKRALFVLALLAVTAVVGAVIYQSAARERDYRLLLARGDQAQADAQTFAAIEDYSGAIALRPDSMLAHLRRGETYRQRGDYEAAARDFRTASALDPTATRPLEQWGDVLYQQKRYKRAAEIFETRLRLDDQSASVRYKLGLAHYRDGNFDAALAALAQAVTLDDQLAEAYYLTGICQREKNRLPEAVSAFEKAVARAPGLIAAREELADLYATLGRRTEEIEQLQVLVGLDSGRVDRRIAVGLAHARAGHADLAVLTLVSALDRAPDQPLIYGALGRVWLDMAQRHDRPDALGKALEALERAASSPTATSDVKTLYGRALIEDHQMDAAERVLQQATERYPADPTAFAEYAAVAEQQNHPDAARNALLAYTSLVKDDADFPERAASIGLLSLKLNDTPAAVAWLRRAAAASPADVRTIAALAEAEVRAGDQAAAQTTVERGLRLDPRNAQLLKLAKRLSRIG